MFESKFSHPTPRLKIRFYQLEDFKSWQVLFSKMNPQQNQWDWRVENIKVLTKERFANKLKKHEEERIAGKCLYFCVEEVDSKAIIGICILNNITISEAEIGFQLNNRYWGKGFGYEIAKGLMEVAFEYLKVSSIYALVNSQNIGSLEILNKLEFFKENINEKGIIKLMKYT